jgi:hypothetical protein
LHRALENIEKPFFEERITKILRSTGCGQSAFFWGRRALGFGRKFRPAAIALCFNQACLFVKLIKRVVICSSGGRRSWLGCLIVSSAPRFKSFGKGALQISIRRR